MKYIFLIKKEGHTFIAALAFGFIIGLMFNSMLGLVIGILSVFYFGIALYAAVLDYARDKELFYANSADAWAQQGDTPEEIKRRQELIAKSGAATIFASQLFDNENYSFEDFLYTKDNNNTYSDDSSSINSPIYDLNNPFNASYGNGTSNYEIMTGTNMSDPHI